MKQKKQILSVVLLTLSLMILILDSKASIEGAKDGVFLCLSVVIPSLFPFLILSAMLPSRLIGKPIKGIRGLCRLCGVPDGSESLLLLSFLSGYPLGASMVADAYRQGRISRSAASRMMGFCNNAGPGFLFGMVGSLFNDRKVVWILWFIHILSALLVGCLLPGKANEACVLNQKKAISVPQALETSLKSMGNICGWVVIFRIVLSVLERWFLWLLPQEVHIGICGLMELSNGIIYLKEILNPGMRFVLCSAILAFGGLCVFMQTVSVTMDLGTGLYFPGKVLQCLFSILFSVLFQYLIFPTDLQNNFPISFYIFVVGGILILTFCLAKKKSSSISGAYIV